VPGGAKNYGRDGAMPLHAPNGRVKNYEPNSFDGPVQTNQEMYAGIGVTGASGHYPQVPPELDDFKQPGDLYRLMPKDAQQRLVDNIAGSLAQVSREDIVARSVEHFRKADAELGHRILEGIAACHGAGVPVAAR
jgi:catalase